MMSARMHAISLRILTLFAVATVALLSIVPPALAQQGIGVGVNIPGVGSIGISRRFCTGAQNGLTGVGDMLCNVAKSIDSIPGLFTAFAYLCGLFLGVMGILKLREHVLNANQVPLADPIKRFIAGGAFFALPMVMEAAQNTLEGSDNNKLQAYDISSFAGRTSGGLSIGPVNIDLPFLNMGGLDKMLVSFVGDIWGPLLGLIGIFGYLAGIILIIIGISRLLKTAQDGPRGPAGFGTIMTFVTAGALFSLDSLMGAFSTSLFKNETVANFAILATGTGSPNVDNHVLAVISAILGFMMIVGWISFVRGLFILRDVAEGNGQASVMAAFTHLIGGAMAVNLGALLNAVQSTFGLLPYGILFAAT